MMVTSKDPPVDELANSGKAMALEKVLFKRGFLTADEHRKYQSHISRLLVDILTAKVKSAPHSFYEIAHTLSKRDDRSCHRLQILKNL